MQTKFSIRDRVIAHRTYYVSILSGILVGGTGYTNGTYNNVRFIGGSGTEGTANITVSGDAVTLVQIGSQGSGYGIGDVLSANASDIGGTGSGFTFTLTGIGNDSNSGDAVSSPWLTPQHAFDWICDNLDISRGIKVTVQCADGTYASNPTNTLYANSSWVGPGEVLFQGNLTNRAAVLWSGGVQTFGLLTGILRFYKIQCANGFTHYAVGIASATDVNSPQFVSGSPGAKLYVLGSYSILAEDKSCHLWAQDQAYLLWWPDAIDVPTPVNYSTGFLFCASANWVDFFANKHAITGTITGKRFSLNNNSVMNALGWNRNDTPGDADGVCAWGARANFADTSIESSRAAMSVAELPVATAGNIGTTYMVNDAITTTFWSIVAGGGSNKIKVTSDGAHWRVG